MIEMPYFAVGLLFLYIFFFNFSGRNPTRSHVSRYESKHLSVHGKSWQTTFGVRDLVR